MRNLVRSVVAVVVMACSVLVGTSGSSAERLDAVHYTVDGVAAMVGSTCPFGDWLPAEVTECEDWHAVLYRSTTTARQHNRVPWRVEVLRARVLVHPGGTVDVLSEAYGIAEPASASFDERHLLFASVRADVAMDDGSTRSVDVTWDGSGSPLETAGNDGPFNQANGIPRHYVDRCITFKHHAHQTYRAHVDAEGTIDGMDVDDLPYLAGVDPFLGRGHFNVTVVQHGGCDR